MEIRSTPTPEGLLPALERCNRDLNYTDAKTLYNCVSVDYRSIWVGVIGDGSNGAYEWFIWDPDAETLQTSNCGYGCVGVALVDGIVQSGAERSAGEHDLVVTWQRKD